MHNFCYLCAVQEYVILFVVVTFVGATIVQIGYWLLLFSRLYRYQNSPPSQKSDEPPVSVVICAKNEANNLSSNLPHILTQKYRSLEILLVDDHSTDNSVEVVLQYQKKYSYLRIINFSYTKKYIGKKEALTLGLNEAQHDFVAVTDADCAPVSPYWLSTMMSHFDDKNIEIVLGYGPYRATKGWLNQFIRYETALTAIQYFSYALAGMPYMGVGRNMMYKRALFAQANGFENHAHIASGDDDLFIREVATSNNVAISLNPDTYVYSDAQPNLHTFFRQKMRHLSTGTHYSRQHQILLGLFGASHAWHYFAFFLLILSKNMIYLALSLYLLRIFTVALINVNVLSKLREQSILKSMVWLDAVMAFYYIVAAPLPFIAKTSTWK